MFKKNIFNINHLTTFKFIIDRVMNQFQEKQLQYKVAMDKYLSNKIYNVFERFISVSVILFQFISIILLIDGLKEINSEQVLFLIPVFIFSYLVTDLVSGLIHMYMDNNTNYTSIFGPLIAAFHMHHNRPRYQNRTPIRVYFLESGSKVWLPIYLLVIICLQLSSVMNIHVHFFFVSFGIVSALAEVSHYWCHNSTSDSKIVTCMQKYYILLPKQHHHLHHKMDNTNYAFLNGVTDPLINIIARKLNLGYKNNADLHVKSYIVLQAQI